MSGITSGNADAKVNKALDEQKVAAAESLVLQTKSAIDRMKTNTDTTLAKNITEVMGMAASSINGAASKFDPS